MKCPFNCYSVPDDCEWAMKHLLCTETEGVVIDMPRRSGKTTKVLNMAYKLAKHGQPVLLFTPTADYANDIQRQIMGSGIDIASIGGWGHSRSKTLHSVSAVEKMLMGRHGIMVFSDEVYPWIADVVKKIKKHRFILGVYSSVG